MMELVVRTADRTRQGRIELDSGDEATTTVLELLDTLKDNFKLSDDLDYFIRSERAGQQLDPGMTIQQAGVETGDVLEVAPILQAGR